MDGPRGDPDILLDAAGEWKNTSRHQLRATGDWGRQRSDWTGGLPKKGKGVSRAKVLMKKAMHLRRTTLVTLEAQVTLLEVTYYQTPTTRPTLKRHFTFLQMQMWTLVSRRIMRWT